MSDQSTGSAGDEESNEGKPPPEDKDLFAPETAGPSIDAPPLPPPPPPAPSVTEIGLPDVIPFSGLDAGGREDTSETAERDEAGEAREEDGAGETDREGKSPEAGEEPAGPDHVEDVPWQVPNPTPPWSSQTPAVDPGPPGPPAPPPPQPPASPPAGTPAAAPPPPPAPAPPVPPAPAGPPAPPAPSVPPAPPGVPPYGAPPPPAPAPGQPGQGYPQAPPGYPPGQMGPPPPMYPAGPQVVDPHMIGSVMNWLGSGAKRAGKMVFPVLAASLEEGDVVDVLVQGRVRGQAGLAALVGTKIVLVNARQWKPDVITIPVTPALQVQGMNYGHSANLLFVDGERQEPVEQITDQPLAVRFAEQVRMRVASLSPPPQPPEPPPAP